MCCRNRQFWLGALAGVLFVAWGVTALELAAPDVAAAAEATETLPMLCHNVYFSLKDDTPENRARLVAACKKYLVKHEGVVFFACGTPSDLARPVNDRNFSVGLHVVFADRAAHDRYQTAPDHLKFIEENRDTWAQVRVFDSDVESVPAK